MRWPSTNASRREGWRKRTDRAAHVWLLPAVLWLGLSACSVRKMVVNSFATTLTEGSAAAYAQDDDPELVEAALPFLLKTIETLLQSAPDNRDLLLAAATGFVQYAHAYVLQPANAVQFTDRTSARSGRERARRLFLRAYEYGLRALSLSLPDVRTQLPTNPEQAVAHASVADVPALYWTAAALGSAIAVSKNDMALVADLPIVRALLNRALELDEGWGDGALHEFFIVLEMSGSEPDAVARAEQHFQRAVELKRGRAVSPLVTFAETVCVKQQDRRRFQALLQQALAFDPNRFPEQRLANLLAQRKARALLANIDYLFFAEDLEPEVDKEVTDSKN